MSHRGRVAVEASIARLHAGGQTSKILRAGDCINLRTGAPAMRWSGEGHGFIPTPATRRPEKGTFPAPRNSNSGFAVEMQTVLSIRAGGRMSGVSASARRAHVRPRSFPFHPFSFATARLDPCASRLADAGHAVHSRAGDASSSGDAFCFRADDAPQPWTGDALSACSGARCGLPNASPEAFQEGCRGDARPHASMARIQSPPFPGG